MSKYTKVTIEQLQQALVGEYITWQQFIEVLIDNFGAAKTVDILKHNNLFTD